MVVIVVIIVPHSSIPYCPYRTLIVTLIDPLKEPKTLTKANFLGSCGDFRVEGAKMRSLSTDSLERHSLSYAMNTL